MTDITQPTGEAPEPARKKSLLRPVLLGFLGALLLGALAFYAVFSGLILTNQDLAKPGKAAVADTVFLALDPITISPPPQRGARFVRLGVQIEVARTSQAEMSRLEPRFVDMINTYLHAVDLDDLRQPAALIKLRSQLLRRFQLIAGEGHLRDILITEFIID